MQPATEECRFLPYHPGRRFRKSRAMSTPSEKSQPIDFFATSNAPAIETAYLQQLTLTHRARARQALRWRSRFLSALSASCSFTFAARAAKISYNTFRLHQRNDPEFARQVAEAEEQAVELLHAQCFKAALEGVTEPVYFQGKVVGHTRKFESRMAIELLRAHMPDKFRTPESKINVNGSNNLSTGTRIGPKELEELQAMRQESLRRMADKETRASEVCNTG